MTTTTNLKRSVNDQNEKPIKECLHSEDDDKLGSDVGNGSDKTLQYPDDDDEEREEKDDEEGPDENDANLFTC